MLLPVLADDALTVAAYLALGKCGAPHLACHTPQLGQGTQLGFYEVGLPEGVTVATKDGLLIGPDAPLGILQDLLGKLGRPFHELVPGHHLVHEAPLQRLLGIHCPPR